MRLYNIFFFAVIFFLTGVLAASGKLNFSVITGLALFIAALFLFFGYIGKNKKLFWFAGLSLFIIIGAFYYLWHEQRQIENLNIPFNQKTEFVGLVSSYSENRASQKLVVDLKEPHRGRILIKTAPYPAYDYGDLIKFEGVINPSISSGQENPSYANYLAKDGIFGIVNFPKTELISTNRGSLVKAALFKLKQGLIENFQKVLSSEKSAFLSGITLGERAEFSKEFKDAMNNSGTTHLVALSGYNITILVIAIASSLGKVLSRRLTFWLTLSIILGFVLMTGAEASVVRAAIMGGIVLLAKQAGRLYSFRNAIAVAAFLMVLENPKILSFDIGFQLSFTALIGIVYLMPAIQKFFRLSEEPGILSWRDNLLTTFSAQTAVTPLLIIYFGKFSPLSLLANLLILTFIPVTMTLGFILGFLGFISYYLSLIFSWFVNLFLFYETFIIKIFGGWDVLKINSLSVPLAVAYYFVLIAFWLYVRHLQIKQNRDKLDLEIN
jgi:competence protein ComEC